MLRRKFKGRIVDKAKYFSALNRAREHFIALQWIVGDCNIFQNDNTLDRYMVDWTKQYQGGDIVITPISTQQISEVLSYCNKNDIGVVPQGGNTGLVGGAVGMSKNSGELILSLSKMNQILDIDKTAGTITCEAGCILESLNNFANDNGFSVPLDLGAKGTCMIGGNVSTNAGGLRLLKYGSFHKNVLGLEVVLSDGKVLNMLRSIPKDNVGYPLKHLFIGSEGTLGIITKVCLSLMVKPRTTQIIFAKCADFNKAVQLLEISKRMLSDNLTAFEFMDARCIKAVRDISPHILSRIQESILPIYEGNTHNVNGLHGITGEIVVLIESTGADEELDAMRLQKFINYIVENGWVEDAVLSQDVQQEKALWHIRENIPISLIQSSRVVEWKMIDGEGWSRRFKLYKYDLSVRLNEMDAFIVELKSLLKRCAHFNLNDGSFNPPDKITDHIDLDAFGLEGDWMKPEQTVAVKLDFCNFGHGGDGNIHLNLLASVDKMYPDVNPSLSDTQLRLMVDEDMKKILLQIKLVLNHYIYGLIVKYKGSISAEHGIGQEKAESMRIFGRSEEEMMVMRTLKNAFDPRGILNPGKVLLNPGNVLYRSSSDLS